MTKRKATDKAKESRRRSKYIQISDNTAAARSAYCCHDGGISPEEVNDDIPLEQLEQLFYETKVVITEEEARDIERITRNQVEIEKWMMVRRKRITASRVGSIEQNEKRYKLYYTIISKATTPPVMAQRGKKRDKTTLLTDKGMVIQI